MNNSDRRLSPRAASSLYPPPGLGCRCPPPGFQFRQIALPFPGNEFQPPLHPTLTSRPTVSASPSLPIRSSIFSRPTYSTALRSTPLAPVSTSRPITPLPISRPAPGPAAISSPEDESIFSETRNLLGPIRRPTPAELSLARQPASQPVETPSNICPATPLVHQSIHQPCHIHLQPVYIWHCCCAANPPPTTDSNATNQNHRQPVHERQVHIHSAEATNEIPEVSILSVFNDSTIERPERPSIDQQESSNAGIIPKRKNRRGRKIRQNEEQRSPTASIRPDLPGATYFSPIITPGIRRNAPSTTREERHRSNLIRPIPIRAYSHEPGFGSQPPLPK